MTALTMIILCTSSLGVYAARRSQRSSYAFSTVSDMSCFVQSKSRRTTTTAPSVGQFPSIGSSTPWLPSGSHDVSAGARKNGRMMSDLKMSTVSDSNKDAIPITLLAGFLGSGKTSTLKHLLENKEGVRIGVIVNDVASVNIDNKLIARGEGGTVELQNGCACCSLSDELLSSVQTVTDNGERPLDAVVVELSGVADPIAVRNNWEAATQANHPATKLAQVSRVVTLIDSCTFGTDWMTWDTFGEREGWIEPGDECAGRRHVPELLVEQVEAADLLLINKVDLAGPDQVKIATTLAKALNEKAEVMEVEFGAVSPKLILSNPVQDATDDEVSCCQDPSCKDPSCEEPSVEDSCCQDPSCEEPSVEDSCCQDPSCEDPSCQDPTHDHSHGDDHDHAASTHDHVDEETTSTHDHSHSHDTNASADLKLGISNFVYKAEVPFNANRLLYLLNDWPVPIKDELDIAVLNNEVYENYESQNDPSSGRSPFIGVLRSKGFCWLAPTLWTGKKEDTWRHNTAMYWSHAGKHFGISQAGKWWGTLNKEEMKTYFADNEKEYDRIIAEDWISDEWGDRRQEIVFIGSGIDEEKITKALDFCLCSDAEMETYREDVENLKKLNA